MYMLSAIFTMQILCVMSTNLLVMRIKRIISNFILNITYALYKTPNLF